MKITLVVNSHTGGKQRDKRLQPIVSKLESSGYSVNAMVTQYHGHATDIVRDLDLSTVDAIVSMGGDGTNFQVLNGLLKHHDHENLPPLGIIPSGRGNSFARDLAIYSIEDGLSALIHQNSRPVDVCTFTQGLETFYFVNLLGVGFVTDVAQTAARFSWTGNLSYVIGVFYRVLQLPLYHLQLEIDGTTIAQRNCFLEVCNSKYTGGAMLMAPEARIDDGWFDLVILSPLSRINLLKTFPKLYRGTHGDNPAVRFIKGKSARIVAIPHKAMLPDGEHFGQTETDIGILPGHVRYFC